MQYDENIDTKIQTLGAAKIPSPALIRPSGVKAQNFIRDDDGVLIDVTLKGYKKALETGRLGPAFELAGPREHIYFDPSKLRCGIVTCGGLCPGLNDIIRAVVLELYHGYGVKQIFGFRYGLQGFIPKYGHDVMDLRPETVVDPGVHGQHPGFRVLPQDRGGEQRRHIDTTRLGRRAPGGPSGDG